MYNTCILHTVAWPRSGWCPKTYCHATCIPWLLFIVYMCNKTYVLCTIHTYICRCKKPICAARFGHTNAVCTPKMRNKCMIGPTAIASIIWINNFMHFVHNSHLVRIWTTLSEFSIFKMCPETRWVYLIEEDCCQNWE